LNIGDSSFFSNQRQEDTVKCNAATPVSLPDDFSEATGTKQRLPIPGGIAPSRSGIVDTVHKFSLCFY